MLAYWPEAGRAAVVCALALAGFWGGVWLLAHFRRRKERLLREAARAPLPVCYACGKVLEVPEEIAFPPAEVIILQCHGCGRDNQFQPPRAGLAPPPPAR